MFLTGEEAPSGSQCRPAPRTGPIRRTRRRTTGSRGTAILDPVTGDFDAVAGLGRHNHENEMVLPGDWDQIAILSGDDTFTPPAPASQLYLYLANDVDEIWVDEGTLWAFQVTAKNGDKVDAADPFNDANDYSDIGLGDHFEGRFIRVPEKVAKGLTSEEPQTALENWSNAHNVFQFIRVEDTAYDPRVGPGENPVMYLSDTGSGAVVENPATGQLVAGRVRSTAAACSGSSSGGQPQEGRGHVDRARRELLDQPVRTRPGPPRAGQPGNELAQPDGPGGHHVPGLACSARPGHGGVVRRRVREQPAVGVERDRGRLGVLRRGHLAHQRPGPLDPRRGPTLIDGVNFKTEGGQLLLLTVPGS